MQTSLALLPAAQVPAGYARPELLIDAGIRRAGFIFTLALIGHDLSTLRNYYWAWEGWGDRDDTPIKTREP